MYCIKCGVKLCESEKKCPLCNTVVCHPDFKDIQGQPLYPLNKMPNSNQSLKALNFTIIVLFLIPLLVCLVADLSIDGKMEWFGYVAGALTVFYIAVALPQWFKSPNPVVFVPCVFATMALYLLYINFETGGNWFLSFALPVVGGISIITCTVVTLMYYLKKGKLYILGGSFIALGAFMLLIEFLIEITFGIRFIGWSFYPMVVLLLFGGLLIYLAIDSVTREIMERKLFF